MAGKLFSRRTKDLDDLRAGMLVVDNGSRRQRIATATNTFRADAALAEAASTNWYILTGEPALPG